MSMAGIDLDLSVIYPTIKYPVSRGTPSLTPLTHWEHSASWRTNNELRLLPSVREELVSLNHPDFQACSDHQVHDEYVLPPTTYLVNNKNLLN